jgi:hypothetical protein
VSAFRFGQTTPDTVRFLDLKRIAAALLGDRAHLADRFGANLSTLAFIFAFLRTGGEEEVGVVAAAESDRVPRTIQRIH